MNIGSSKRLLELDALRGIAAVLVVFFHFAMGFGNEYMPYFKFGVTGVELFFIISGFVIFMSVNNLDSGREFIANRFVRLYPAFWICGTITFLAQIVPPLIQFHFLPERGKMLQYLGNLTMFQYYMGVGDIDGSYWSLIVEMIFYVFIYLLFVTKLLKRTEIITLMIIVAMEALRLTHTDKLYQTINKALPLLSYLPLFLAGIVFYKMYAGRQSVIRYLLVAFCFVVELQRYWERIFSYFSISIYEYALVLGIYFLFFILFINNKLSFLAVRPLVYLGSVSYVLYLIHEHISLSLIIPLLLQQWHLSFLLTCTLTFAAVVSMASVITFYLEVPLRGKLRIKLRRAMGLSDAKRG